MFDLFKALLPLLGYCHSSRFLDVGMFLDDFALALAEQALAIWVVGMAFITLIYYYYSAIALIHSESCWHRIFNRRIYYLCLYYVNTESRWMRFRLHPKFHLLAAKQV